MQLNPEYGRALNNLGAIRREFGDYTSAIELFERAVRTEPRSAESRNNLGLSYADAGRLSEAIAAYDQALQVD
ncbi:uncharacterized protein METZ01_LOCUS395697, partial [marine metagenome]